MLAGVQLLADIQPVSRLRSTTLFSGLARILTQVLSLEAAGHEIGAHTKHHVFLTQVSTSTQQDEIAGSRADLLDEGEVGVDSVTSIAYP